MLLVILLVLLFFGGFGSFHTWNNPSYGPNWGGGIGLGTILIIVVLFLLLRGRF
jgi:hypothetical protein